MDHPRTLGGQESWRHALTQAGQASDPETNDYHASLVELSTDPVFHYGHGIQEAKRAQDLVARTAIKVWNDFMESRRTAA